MNYNENAKRSTNQDSIRMVRDNSLRCISRGFNLKRRIVSAILMFLPLFSGVKAVEGVTKRENPDLSPKQERNVRSRLTTEDNSLAEAWDDTNVERLQTVMTSVKLFHDRVVDVNEVYGKQKRTALMYAASIGDIFAAKRLLDYGADINAKDNDGWTALMFAADSGNADTVQFLLDKGANAWDNVTRDSITAMDIAVTRGSGSVVNILMNNYVRKINNGNYWDLLLVSATRGDYGVTRAILRTRSFNVNEVRGGLTPLMMAIQHGRNYHIPADIVKLLIRRSAVNAKYPNFKTALMRAVDCGNLRMVRALLEDPRIDVNAVDLHNTTALMMAAGKGRCDVVKELLRKNANVNLRDYKGRTALMYAVGSRSGDVIKVLFAIPNIEVEPKYMVENIERRSAIIWAAKRGREDVITEFLNVSNKDLDFVCDDGKTALMCAAESGHQGIVRQLLSCDSFLLNRQDKDGNTALMLAAHMGENGIVQLLLDDGADVSIKNKLSRTALIEAAMVGQVGVVDTLLELDETEVNEQDDCGNTALIWAARGGYMDVVEDLLEDSRTDPDIQNNEGKTYRDFVETVSE